MSEAKKEPVPAVYGAIAKVMQTLAKEGISKDRNNEQQGYKFRGIDDVYNALAPALVDAGLIVVPEFSQRTCAERTTTKGSVLFYVTVQGKFSLSAASDGSTIVAGPFFGEAMDSGDKATNKAMSAAYKYFAMQTFSIPTDADNDSDATTHADVTPKAAAPKPHGTLSTAEFARHKNAIGMAKNEIELRKAYSLAYVAAQTIGDADAVNRLTDLKDERKQKLAQPQTIDAEEDINQ